jgi:transposase-like protein
MPPPKCPICGTTNVKKGLYEDGEKSYHCENGHSFLVKKKSSDRSEAS